MVGGGLFSSPTPAKKSPTPAGKSPTAIPKRCWTLEYSGELEFSSPFMEQWTLDARGVLLNIQMMMHLVGSNCSEKNERNFTEEQIRFHF